jgi:hypothetical protein
MVGEDRCAGYHGVMFTDAQCRRKRGSKFRLGDKPDTITQPLRAKGYIDWKINYVRFVST